MFMGCYNLKLLMLATTMVKGNYNTKCARQEYGCILPTSNKMYQPALFPAPQLLKKRVSSIEVLSTSGLAYGSGLAIESQGYKKSRSFFRPYLYLNHGIVFCKVHSIMLHRVATNIELSSATVAMPASMIC